MSSSFDGSILFISARSPFARRVRIGLWEAGISFQETVLDVFKPQPELWKANPLARVPALRLRDGQILIDSSMILTTLYEEIESPFMPRELERRREVYRWQAIALGLAEKTVEYFLETLRPAGSQDPGLFAEVESAYSRSFELLEAALGSRDYVVENGGEPTQADFDLGAALAYIRLRHPMKWQIKYPRSAALLARLDARESFRKTVPPAAG